MNWMWGAAGDGAIRGQLVREWRELAHTDVKAWAVDDRTGGRFGGGGGAVWQTCVAWPIGLHLWAVTTSPEYRAGVGGRFFTEQGRPLRPSPTRR